MNKEVKIKDILALLRDKDIQHTFSGNQEEVIMGFSTLFNYKPQTMTFISTLYDFKDYEEKFEEKKIKLIITDPSEKTYDCFVNVIQIEKPTNSFFTILENFYSHDNNGENSPICTNEEHYKKHSFISEHAKIGTNVKVGYGCVIEPNVTIGNNTTIHHNVVLRSGTKIGENCTVCTGTVIGEDGFNPSTQKDGSKELLKHFGGVTIEDNVYIGANCNIHRGSIDDTILCTGVKVNSMVHISHNCYIDNDTVITTPTHICGSVKIGKQCHIAATTIRNQCTIGDNVVLGLGAVVVKDVENNVTMVGNPARRLEK